ncbi:hypothetical protein [Proteiniphilum sp. UBA5384]|nr:hypothetical protein [Proteiniphilum sp. UBA5384]
MKYNSLNSKYIDFSDRKYHLEPGEYNGKPQLLVEEMKQLLE